MLMNLSSICPSLVFHVVFLLIVNPCFLSSAHSEEKSLKIGVVFALTGQASHWSDMNLKGLQLAQEDLKAEGWNIQLVVEDSKTDPAGSVRSFTKLVHVDKVQAVVGNIWSYLTEPLIPLAVRSKTLLIGPELDCVAGSPYTFHGGTQLDSLHKAYEDYFRLHPEIQSSVVINFDDPGWGHRQRDAWISAARKNQVTIDGHIETAEHRPDFKSMFPRLLRLKPDSVFVAHEPHLSMQALRLLHYPGSIVQSNALYEALISNLGSVEEFEGVFYADSLPSDDFAKRFEGRFGLPPVLEPQKSYEILRSLVAAFNLDRKNPHLGMTKVKYSGVAGQIDYTSGCAGNHSEWHLFKVVAGRPKVVSVSDGVEFSMEH